MAQLPVQGIVENDFVSLLAVVDDTDPVSTVALQIAAHAIGKRVPPQDRPLRVRHRGVLLDDDSSLADAGCAPMDVLEVKYA